MIITNLFPLPWEPNRATFNRQQFAQLDDDFDKSILIPVAFSQWFKHRKQIQQSNDVRYVPYFYLPKLGRRFYSVFMFLSILLHSGYWLTRKKPETILASWAFPEAVAASWLSKLFSCKFFFKVHGSDINLHGKIPARAKQIVNAAKRASGILSVSNALAQEMIQLGIAAEKIKVIYNGVNHEKFGLNNPAVESLKPLINAKTIENGYVIFVGNLKTDKGVIELLEGFAKISEQHPHLTLVYAGPGALKNNLLSQAEQLHIASRIICLGAVDHEELPALISQATLLALPSYNEGVPNVVLEAMACGTPVLATNVGGIPEVVDEAICGKLIEPKNADAVADGLNIILTTTWQPELIKQHSQQFSWQNNKKQLLQLLNTL